MKGKLIICAKIVLFISCITFITFPLFTQSYLQIYEITTIFRNKSQINNKSNNFHNDSITLISYSRRYLYKIDSLVIIYDSLIDGEFYLSPKSRIPMAPFLKSGSVRAHHGIGVYDISNKKFVFNNDSIIYFMNLNDIPPFRVKGNNVVFENYKDIVLKLRKSNHQTYYPFFNELFANYEVEYFKIPDMEIKIKYSGKPIIFVDEKKVLELKSLLIQKKHKSKIRFSEFILKR